MGAVSHAHRGARGGAGKLAGSQCVSLSLQKYPHPYRAMLAICSDLDNTPDRGVYRNIVRFLNTRDDTGAMGPGVGLEVGNSIFFMMQPDQYSYFGTDEPGRELARALMRSGHIDCIHSYGDLARTRGDAERVLAELERHGCKLQVWVDHSKAPSNFGPDIMRGTGDVPGAEAYHADLTLAYGVRYVWRGRTTVVTGQNAAIGLRELIGVLDRHHPAGSAKTMLKEAVKIFLGRRGHPRWQMYGANRVLRTSRLRDGQAVWEFIRSNPHWQGSGLGATADGVGTVLTQRMLDHLVRREAVCVLYTHLGKVSDRTSVFNEPARAAFRRLAAMRDAGRVHVTTTHRLLRYLAVRDSVKYQAVRTGERVVIDILSVDDPVSGRREPSPEDLMGLTFVTDRCAAASARLPDGTPVGVDLVQDGGRTILSFRWRPLVLPET